MMIQRLTTVAIGVMLSGGLVAASAVAQPKTAAHPQVQHLTCVQDTQGLMCNVDESSNPIGTDRVNSASADISVPAAITAEQLAQLSNLLLGIIYLGLPSALLLAVIQHDRRAQEQTQLIAQLERIWNDPRY